MTTPELRTLMGAYFHQDFETVWGAFDEYLDDASPEELSGLVAEIDTLLDKPVDEAELESLLDGLGNSADMSGRSGGYRGWLEEIARRVRAHLGE